MNAYVQDYESCFAHIKVRKLLHIYKNKKKKFNNQNYNILGIQPGLSQKHISVKASCV